MAKHTAVAHIKCELPSMLTGVDGLACFLLMSRTRVTLWCESERECPYSQSEDIQIAHVTDIVDCLTKQPRPTFITAHTVPMREDGVVATVESHTVIRANPSAAEFRANGTDYRQRADAVFSLCSISDQRTILHVRAMLHVVVWSIVMENEEKDLTCDYSPCAIFPMHCPEEFTRVLSIAILIASYSDIHPSLNRVVPWLLKIICESLQGEESALLYDDLVSSESVSAATLKAVASRITRVSVLVRVLSAASESEPIHVFADHSMAPELCGDFESNPLFSLVAKFGGGFAGSVFIRGNPSPIEYTVPLKMFAEFDKSEIDTTYEDDVAHPGVVVYAMMPFLLSLGMSKVGFVRKPEFGLWVADESASSLVVHITADRRRAEQLVALSHRDGIDSVMIFPLFYKVVHYNSKTYVLFVYDSDVGRVNEHDEEELNELLGRLDKLGLRTDSRDPGVFVSRNGRLYVTSYQHIVYK